VNKQRRGEAPEPLGGLLRPGDANLRLDNQKYAKKAIAAQLPESPVLPSNLHIPLKDRKHAVLELIDYPWEALGFDIVFLNSRPGYRAMTLSERQRIEIYIRQGDDLMLQAYDLAHELGHAYDLKYNDDARRRKWLALRGIGASTPWFGCDACPDYGTPAGDFAETFAFLLLGPGNFHSTLSPQPREDQMLELAAFCRIQHISEAFNISDMKEDKPMRDPQEIQVLPIDPNATSARPE